MKQCKMHTTTASFTITLLGVFLLLHHLELLLYARLMLLDFGTLALLLKMVVYMLNWNQFIMQMVGRQWWTQLFQ